MPPSLSSRDVLLQTDNIEQAKAFYENVLHLSVFLHEDNLIGLEAGALRLFLERGPAYGPVLEFYVDDVATAKQALLAAGCRVEEEDPDIPRCYIRDPFGLTFNIAARS